MWPLLKRLNLNLAAAFSALLSLAGCSTMQPQDFAHSTTTFDLQRFFTGHNRSWGVFENGGGAPRRTFVADSFGKLNPDGSLALTQHFRFSDGKRQLRVWRVRRVDATHWEATANDVVGKAMGESRGNALYWEYTITVNPKNPLATVHVCQWIYQPEGTETVMTRLRITKMGMPLFQVTESIHHVSP